MDKKTAITRNLAIIGTIFVWLPLLAPVFFSLIRLIQSGRFMLDYLMPAELLPAVVIGSGLLIWAAFRARSRHKIILWSFIIGIAALFGGQGIAVVTGLAFGELQSPTWQLPLVIGLIVVYILAVIVIAVNGVLLLRGLSKAHPGQ